MPIPLNKVEQRFHTIPGLTHLKSYYGAKNGINNQQFKGKVSSPYTAQKCFTTSIMHRRDNGAAFAYDCQSQFGLYGLLSYNRPGMVPAFNRAYARFKEEATGSQSQLGTLFAEWRQTADLVTSTAVTVRQAWLSFRRGRFARFIETKIDPRNIMRNNHNFSEVRYLADRASAAWLQFWFGIAPTMGDCTTALEQASDPIPSNENYEGSDRMNIYERGGGVQTYEVSGVYRCATGARIRLVNPNLYLASQLGLVNPMSVAWEIIPFSFLVDWAFDVSGFIESFSDFVGCEVTMPYSSAKISGITSTTYPSVFTGSWVSHQVQFQRNSSLWRPTPNFQVQANLGVSLTRAASAVSLLIQALKPPR